MKADLIKCVILFPIRRNTEIILQANGSLQRKQEPRADGGYCPLQRFGRNGSQIHIDCIPNGNLVYHLLRNAYFYLYTGKVNDGICRGWMGISRLYLGVHFPSDVVSGALIGFVLAKITIFCFAKITEKMAQQSFS